MRVGLFRMFIFLITAAMFQSTHAAAQTSLAVAAATANRIEEDWSVVVASYDTDGVGPQITTSMSPVSDNSTPFVAFDLNYREYPDFIAGGMQTQIWSGANLSGYATQSTSQLQNNNETITWTQRMTLGSGSVTYLVLNGSSQSFGQFGQTYGLSPVSFSTSVTSFAGYSPATSIKNSGASWESNLVTSMTLTQVRYYSGSTLLATDSTQYSVNLNP
jgi:hypothetical protein